MNFKKLTFLLICFLLVFGSLKASEDDLLNNIYKKLIILEKEVLDLKMKNIVENKFEWQFLKMTEIENDIKKLHNRFEILENNYYKELKKFKAMITDGKNEEALQVDNLQDKEEQNVVIKRVDENTSSLETLQNLGLEEELLISGINYFKKDQFKFAEKQFTKFIEVYPTSSKISSAFFWRAEVRAKSEEWIGAANDYLESFTINPDSENAAKTLFGLGVSLGAIGEKDQACLTLDEVGSRFKNIETTLLDDILRAKNLLSCG